jgi:heptosyltransferase-2
MLTDKTILLGFYTGIGDLVSAVPTMHQLQRQNNRLIIAARPILRELLQLTVLDQRAVCFAPIDNRGNYRMREFLASVKPERVDYVFLSPHASKVNSCWKTPLLSRMLGVFLWPSAVVVGAADQRCSRWFHRRYLVDTGQPLVQREWRLHHTAGSIDSSAPLDHTVFRGDLLGTPPARYDLVVHPGASRSHHRWRVAHWQRFFSELPSDLRIACIVPPNEPAEGSRIAGYYDGATVISGGLVEAIQTAASSRVALTMDSGFSHVAAALGLEHIALFFATDPSHTPPASESSRTMFRRELPCQPCGLRRCPIPGMPCRDTLSPGEIARQVVALLTSEPAISTEKQGTGAVACTG